MSFRGGQGPRTPLGRDVRWAGRPVRRMGGLWSNKQCFVPWCVKSAPDRGPAEREHSPPRQSLHLVGAFSMRPASRVSGS